MNPEYLCPNCGYRFTTYNEHFEIVDPKGRVTGIGCAKCGAEAEKLEPICNPCDLASE